MDAPADDGQQRLAVVLGGIAILLGVILIVWFWVDERRFWGAGLFPVLFGMLSIESARRRR